MQAQLTHVARLSTLGEMVAGIAHEVNQPLYSIGNFAQAIANVTADEGTIDLANVRKWNDAIVDFSHAISLDPKNPVYYQARAKAKAGKGDTEGAKADQTQAEALKN